MEQPSTMGNDCAPKNYPVGQIPNKMSVRPLPPLIAKLYEAMDEREKHGDYFETLLESKDDAYVHQEYRELLDDIKSVYEAKICSQTPTFIPHFENGLYDREALHMGFLVGLCHSEKFAKKCRENSRPELHCFIYRVKYEIHRMLTGAAARGTPGGLCKSKEDMVYLTWRDFVRTMRTLYLAHWNEGGKSDPGYIPQSDWLNLLQSK
jgi:hypothetical protein